MNTKILTTPSRCDSTAQ